MIPIKWDGKKTMTGGHAADICRFMAWITADIWIRVHSSGNVGRTINVIENFTTLVVPQLHCTILNTADKILQIHPVIHISSVIHSSLISSALLLVLLVEIKPSPLPDHVFGIAFPHVCQLDLSLDTFYLKLKMYLFEAPVLSNCSF